MEERENETIKIKPIKDACKELMSLYMKAEDAKITYANAVKGLAERSGADVSAIKKLVSASANGKFEKIRHRVEQQQVLFESVGEIYWQL